MTRDKDNEKALYDLLGNKDERKKFNTQFKKAESNSKIAINALQDQFREEEELTPTQL
ncbi:MAG: hypothetical protein AAF555_01965 [Verrucomicrobiota bacterium]